MRIKGNSECNLCPLYEKAQAVCIMGQGLVPCDTMVIGEAPSLRKGDINKPFSGPSGKYLERELNNLKIKREDLYITNAIKCRPEDNKTPKIKEIKACFNWLELELKEVKPKYVLLLGSTAIKSIFGSKSKITLARGKVVENNGIKYFATFHPAAILRDINKQKLFKTDLRKFKQLISKGKIQEHSKGFCFKVVDYQDDKILGEAKKDLLNSKSLSFDLETNSLNPWKEDSIINCIGISTKDKQWIFPISHRDSPLKTYEEKAHVVKYLTKLVSKKRLYAHNAKFDSLFLRVKYRVKWSIKFDSMFASFLIDENGSHGLKELSSIYFGAPNYDLDKKAKLGDVPIETLGEYCSRDVYYTRKLTIEMRKQLKRFHRLYKFFKILVIPMINMFVDIEDRGVYIDYKRLEKTRDIIRGEIKELKSQLDKYAIEFNKPDINWNSTQQISEILFEKLGLDPVEVTKSGFPSTSESVLKRLSLEHELPKLLLTYRNHTKMLTGFLESWEEKLVNGRIHPSFKLHGTVTGRLSCTDPNLQQVPRNPQIRSIITAPKGWTLIEADYSQVELRVAAMLAGDKEMINTFVSGGDIHLRTAQIISGKKSVKADEMKEWRKKAKAINFGLIYGMGAKKLMQYAGEKYGIDMSLQEATKFRDKFFKTYSYLPLWHKRQIRLVRNNGYVTNLFGRIRHLPEIYSFDFKERAGAERKSINSPVQSLASDLLIMSGIDLYNLLYKTGYFYIVGTIHDALLMEVKTSKLDSILPQIKKTMENPPSLKKLGVKFSVPIIVDIALGSWGSGKKWSEK